ncbi:MAG: gluconokinase [Candidatus Methylomirabilia bacterium]
MAEVAPARSEHPLILAVDIGSSAVRALVFDRLGRGLSRLQVRLPYQARTTADGRVEVEAEVIVRLVTTAIDRILDRAGRRRPGFGGVALSTFWHTVLGVGIDGRPVTPLLSWADTRSRHAASMLRQTLDERAIHSRTGCRLHCSYVPSKLLWLSQTQLARFHRATRWMSIGEYLYWRFFGRATVSVSMASASGLLDLRNCVWDREVLAALPVQAEQLSQIDDAPARGLSKALARRWPALKDVPWFPAWGDGACSNIGSGCFSPERAALSVGTSGAMRVVWEGEPREIPPGLWCYRVDHRRLVLGGALSNAGSLYAWLRRLLRMGPVAAVERAVAGMSPDNHGLTLLPFLSGERSPGWVSAARGVIEGLTLSTTRLDLLRAGLEAVAYRFLAIDTILRQAFPEAYDVVASGGGLVNSPAWTQLMADVLGRPVITSGEPEASSRGAALLAFEALGLLRIDEIPNSFGKLYHPRWGAHARYREAFRRQTTLYRNFASWWEGALP